MAFTNEQLERYSRHIILKEVGAKGQKKLLNASVLIIGAGGLGAPAAMYLAEPELEQSVLLMLMRLIYLIFRDRLSIQQQISVRQRLNLLKKQWKQSILM